MEEGAEFILNSASGFAGSLLTRSSLQDAHITAPCDVEACSVFSVNQALTPWPLGAAARPFESLVGFVSREMQGSTSLQQQQQHSAMLRHLKKLWFTSPVETCSEGASLTQHFCNYSTWQYVPQDPDERDMTATQLGASDTSLDLSDNTKSAASAQVEAVHPPDVPSLISVQFEELQPPDALSAPVVSSHAEEVHPPEALSVVSVQVEEVHLPESAPPVSAQVEEVHLFESTPPISAQVEEVHLPESTPPASTQVEEVHLLESTPPVSAQVKEAHLPESAPRASAQVEEVHLPESTPPVSDQVEEVYLPESAPPVSAQVEEVQKNAPLRSYADVVREQERKFSSMYNVTAYTRPDVTHCDSPRDTYVVINSIRYYTHPNKSPLDLHDCSETSKHRPSSSGKQVHHVNSYKLEEMHKDDNIVQHNSRTEAPTAVLSNHSSGNHDNVNSKSEEMHKDGNIKNEISSETEVQTVVIPALSNSKQVLDVISKSNDKGKDKDGNINIENSKTEAQTADLSIHSNSVDLWNQFTCCYPVIHVLDVMLTHLFHDWCNSLRRISCEQRIPATTQLKKIIRTKASQRSEVQVSRVETSLLVDREIGFLWGKMIQEIMVAHRAHASLRSLESPANTEAEESDLERMLVDLAATVLIQDLPL